MKKAFERHLVWLAMAAVAVNGHVFAQELGGAPIAGTYQEDSVPAQPVFSVEQVEQMVAPIALYPDALLAQVLMAATYPIEVAQADQWLKKNSGLDGEALDAAIAPQPWDPSVKTLVFFPAVLERMAQDLTWTQDLGDAFLAQEADVMGAVQRLRRQAQDAGNLVSTDQQIVRTQGSTIVVEPADPAVVYVPTYNPTTVYGSSWAPTTRYYPDTYGSGSSLPTWVAFGAGALVGALLVAAIDWADDDDYYVVHRHYYPRRHHRHIYHYGPTYWSSEWVGPRYGRPTWRTYRPTYISRGDVYIDKSKTINIEKTYVKREWEHNPVHRRSVSYRDPKVAKRFVGTDATRRDAAQGTARLDRDGAEWRGPEGTRQLDRDRAQSLDRDALRRLDRSQPAMVPSDRGTREALQGDERERRARILRDRPDGRPESSGAQLQKRDQGWQFQQRQDPRQLQQRPDTRQFQQRQDPRQLQPRPDTRQFQQRQDPRQLQPRPDARQFQQRQDPRQLQQRPDTRQFQQRAEPRSMPPTVQRSQDGGGRQLTPQRSAPQRKEQAVQRSGEQGGKQSSRKRDDDKNQFSR